MMPTPDMLVSAVSVENKYQERSGITCLMLAV